MRSVNSYIFYDKYFWKMSTEDRILAEKMKEHGIRKMQTLKIYDNGRFGLCVSDRSHHSSTIEYISRKYS